jgi:ribonuclease J
MKNTNNEIKLFALGGLCEVGKNCYVMEYLNQIFVIDAGILFPDIQLHGIDYVIPDFDYLEKNQERIVGLFITHGHEDHIGGIPYLLKKVRIPKIYACGIAIELIKGKLNEHNIAYNDIIEYNSNSVITFRNTNVRFIELTHSIPDAHAIVIKTHLGNVVFTGDFKIDLTPIGKPINFQKISEISKEGVICLLSDSTNAEHEGHTASERKVADSIKAMFGNIDGRVIIATFASNIYRVQQIVEASIAHKRKILVFGRSMERTIDVGQTMGYINVPDNTFIDISQMNKYEPHELTLICTGSQGETMAALSRIAAGIHRQIKLLPNDTVIFSSSPIPGNTQYVNKTINLLMKKGINVITNSPFTDTHTSGHGGQMEQKYILSLFKPKYFFPNHGDYRMLKKHANSAYEVGIEKGNAFVMDNGDILTINDERAYKSGKIKINDVYIDSGSVGNITSTLLRERKQLSEDGVLAILFTVDSKTKQLEVFPSTVSKGFLFMKESEEITNKILQYAKNVFIEETTNMRITENALKVILSEKISKFVQEITEKKPLLIPVILYV